MSGERSNAELLADLAALIQNHPATRGGLVIVDTTSYQLVLEVAEEEGYELSEGDALAVLKYLADHGLSARDISEVIRAHFKPSRLGTLTLAGEGVGIAGVTNLTGRFTANVYAAEPPFDGHPHALIVGHDEVGYKIIGCHYKDGEVELSGIAHMLLLVADAHATPRLAAEAEHYQLAAQA